MEDRGRTAEEDEGSMMTEQLPDERLKDAIGREAFDGDLIVNEAMKNHTTLRIGGPADVYAVPKDLSSMKNLLSALKEEDLPAMPLGGGSNLLVSDKGIEGVVISMASFDRMEVLEERAEGVRLLAEAGTPLGRLLNFARGKGYKGLEGLTGIPGSIGGAIRGNAGSFGFEICDVIESVAVMDMSGKTFSMNKEEISFEYRFSGISDSVVVLSAAMRFEKDDVEQVTKRMEGFHREKLGRQPIDRFSAGCVFKNPGGTHAGALIDQAGCKGMRQGGIEVSRLHANFFINTGDGKAADFLALMDEVRERVMKAFGIELEPEIRIAGRP